MIYLFFIFAASLRKHTLPVLLLKCKKYFILLLNEYFSFFLFAENSVPLRVAKVLPEIKKER